MTKTNLINVPLTRVGESVLKYTTGYHPSDEWGAGMMSVFQLAQLLVRLRETTMIKLVPNPTPRDVAFAIVRTARQEREGISSTDQSVIARGARALRTVNPEYFDLSFKGAAAAAK